MASNESSELDALAALSSLDDPVRRRLYEYVSGRDEPVSRDRAATAAGIGRTLAAYHLDKLADAGLLSTSYQRPPGRAGPGAGRPAKLYTRAERELQVSVPPRDYELLARLLVSSVQADADGKVREAVHEAAFDAGRAAGTEPGGDLMAALRGCGYQPQAQSHGCIELRNCPFHRLAQDYLEVVCGLNLHLVRGILVGSSDEHARAELNPQPGRCCVLVHNTGSAHNAQER